MAEYSKIAKGSFVSSGQAQVINLPFQPDYVEFENWSVANSAPTVNGVASAKWWSNMGQGTADERVYASYGTTPTVLALVADTVTLGGISTFSAGTFLQFGPTVYLGASGSVVSSSSTVTTVTTTTAHGLSTGQWVTFQSLYAASSTTTGMQQIAGIPFMVTVTGATTFTINWNSTGGNYTTVAGVSSSAGPSFKQILYPTIYVPGVSFIQGISGNTVTTTAPHNLKVGQQVAFRIAPQWGAYQLNSLPDNSIPGQPIYYYVTAVTINTFTLSSLPAYTAFNPNQPFANYRGEFFPQVVSVGDVNTGGFQYNGGQLYPSPQFYNNSLTLSNSINGPAIQGAYCNNTSQGFIIGIGAGTNQTSSSLVGASGNIIYWRALYHDLSM